MLSMLVYVAYNEDGDFAADADEDAAVERLAEEIGAARIRVVSIRVNAPEPRTIHAGDVHATSPREEATAEEDTDA